MKSLGKSTVKEPSKDLGRAIARGMSEETAQKEKNQAKADKRKDTMLRNAAEKMFSQNY